MNYSTLLPPIGAAKQHPTPTAQAAASISMLRDSFYQVGNIIVTMRNISLSARNLPANVHIDYQCGQIVTLFLNSVSLYVHTVDRYRGLKVQLTNKKKHYCNIYTCLGVWTKERERETLIFYNWYCLPQF